VTGARLVVCGIAGSLRTASYNHALLRTATELAPADMEIRIFERIGDLPHYNEDVEREAIPSRSRLSSARSPKRTRC
jgi:chromate reductase